MESSFSTVNRCHSDCGIRSVGSQAIQQVTAQTRIGLMPKQRPDFVGLLQTQQSHGRTGLPEGQLFFLFVGHQRSVPDHAGLRREAGGGR